MKSIKSLPHDSARGHVTGESVFVDDRAFLSKELLVGIKGAPVNAGRLKSLRFDKALLIEGVVGVLTSQDLKVNHWGTIVDEQPLLVEDQIGYIDEPCCIVVAENPEALAKGLALIEIEVEETPSIDFLNAIQTQNFLYTSTPFVKGDGKGALESSVHRLQGEFFVGGQEHFYLESQACVVYPLEEGQVEIHSSTQHPSEVQHVVAHCLGLPMHHVVVDVKRMGGGFGGKETQGAPLAALCTLAALKFKRPARLILTKDQDMQVTGKRHPFLVKYDVGFNEAGKIQALHAVLFADGGAYTDLTPSILDRGMFHIDGAYHLEHALIEGYACRTHRHSNTAFRGFGGPQGAIAMESMLEDMAQFLGKDALQIRQLNVYKPHQGQTTPYGQVIEDCTLPLLFEKLERSSDYQKRRKQVDQFNKLNRFKLRGLSMMATKFGIAFTARHLNQGNALVHGLQDGTVQVSTGATEMGQGVNAKIKQTVAEALGIFPQHVVVLSTNTTRNANTSATAASSGADLNCAAAHKACVALRSRLSWMAHHLALGYKYNGLDEIGPPPLDWDGKDIVFTDGQIHVEGKKFEFAEVLRSAYLNRLSLSEYAQFKTEGIGFNKTSGQGTPFKYFSNGVAATEVELNLFTGELKVLRTDILMDLGRPLNAGLDRGQVIGAFIQGMGWLTSENLYYAQNGRLVSHSPTTYKIPNIQDVPRHFEVQLLEGVPNPQGFKGSKAVGEPPLVLAGSVWTAIKNALQYRAEKRPVQLKGPATNEEILMEYFRLVDQ